MCFDFFALADYAVFFLRMTIIVPYGDCSQLEQVDSVGGTGQGAEHADCPQHLTSSLQVDVEIL